MNARPPACSTQCVVPSHVHLGASIRRNSHGDVTDSIFCVICSLDYVAGYLQRHSNFESQVACAAIWRYSKMQQPLCCEKDADAIIAADHGLVHPSRKLAVRNFFTNCMHRVCSRTQEAINKPSVQVALVHHVCHICMLCITNDSACCCEHKPSAQPDWAPNVGVLTSDKLCCQCGVSGCGSLRSWCHLHNNDVS
jgi:hypothetical protein